MLTTGIYLHIPFCQRRCGYCDFNTYAGFSHAIPDYVKALRKEIERTTEHHEQPSSISTIYFGGGTPSLLTGSQFSDILNQINQSFKIDPDAEITLEANPGTVDAQYLKFLHEIGFSRISFGLQSPHPEDLRALDRRHDFFDAVKAVKWSQQAGFEHINLDLIFGIPGQTLERWEKSLELVCNMGVDHLSLYNLTIEDGTPLNRWYQKGLLQPLDEDLNAAMYQSAGEILQTNGFLHYEISNWARVRRDGIDCRSRHNLNTWRYQPYYGFGAGASGFIGDERTANYGFIPLYLEKMKFPSGEWAAAQEVIRMTRWDEMQEWMMVGLRLTDEGISQEEFRQRFGISCHEVFKDQLERCIRRGLLEEFGVSKDRIRLTKRGALLGNQVFIEFVGNESPKGFSLDQ